MNIGGFFFAFCGCVFALAIIVGILTVAHEIFVGVCKAIVNAPRFARWAVRIPGRVMGFCFDSTRLGTGRKRLWNITAVTLVLVAITAYVTSVFTQDTFWWYTGMVTLISGFLAGKWADGYKTAS